MKDLSQKYERQEEGSSHALNSVSHRRYPAS